MPFIKRHTIEWNIDTIETLSKSLDKERANKHGGDLHAIRDYANSTRYLANQLVKGVDELIDAGAEELGEVDEFESGVEYDVSDD